MPRAIRRLSRTTFCSAAKHSVERHRSHLCRQVPPGQVERAFGPRVSRERTQGTLQIVARVDRAAHDGRRQPIAQARKRRGRPLVARLWAGAQGDLAPTRRPIAGDAHEDRLKGICRLFIAWIQAADANEFHRINVHGAGMVTVFDGVCHCWLVQQCDPPTDSTANEYTAGQASNGTRKDYFRPSSRRFGDLDRLEQAAGLVERFLVFARRARCRPRCRRRPGRRPCRPARRASAGRCRCPCCR